MANTGQAANADVTGAGLSTIVDGAARAEDYAGRSKSAATIKAYASGWRDFLQFCEQREASPLPAREQTVAAYLAALADGGAKAATIARRLVVISQAHRAADLPSPTTSSLVRRTHAGIRRQEGTVRLWDPQSGREVGRVSVGAGNPTHGVSISPDGRYLAGGDDHSAHVWDLSTLQQVAHFGHDSAIYGVAFSPDSRHIATTSSDATVGIWDSRTGDEVARMAHEGAAFSVAYSPDGRLLVTGGDDWTARIWTVDPTNLLSEACSRITRNLTLQEWQQ